MINFPTSFPMFLGGGHDEPELEYRVGAGRVGNDMAIYISKDHHQIFHRYVPLQRRFYHLISPAERIRRTILKAQKIADKANHDELYINHEAEIGMRQ